jgi:hypothetical protein
VSARIVRLRLKGHRSRREGRQAGLRQLISPRVSRRQLAIIWSITPTPSLIVGTDLLICGANERYMQMIMKRPEELLGRHVFDVLADNPAEDGSRGLVELRASFDRVITRRVSDTMHSMRYDIRTPAGVFVERYWNFSNHPVADRRSGALLYVLHTAADVTESVLQARQIKQAGTVREASEVGKDIGETVSLTDPPLADDLLSIAIQTYFDNLTSREKEVLKLAIAGKANKDIAFTLGISVRTVESFRTSILRKTLKANFLEISRAVHDLARSDQEKR